MLGFSVTISELKAQPTTELIEDAKTGDWQNTIENLDYSFRGEGVAYIPNTWDVPFPVEEDSLPVSADNERMIYAGGYPTIFTALGSKLISGFEKHSEQLTLVKPDTLYLVTVWDLS